MTIGMVAFLVLILLPALALLFIPSMRAYHAQYKHFRRVIFLNLLILAVFTALVPYALHYAVLWFAVAWVGLTLWVYDECPTRFESWLKSGNDIVEKKEAK